MHLVLSCYDVFQTLMSITPRIVPTPIAFSYVSVLCTSTSVTTLDPYCSFLLFHTKLNHIHLMVNTRLPHVLPCAPYPLPSSIPSTQLHTLCPDPVVYKPTRPRELALSLFSCAIQAYLSLHEPCLT